MTTFLGLVALFLLANIGLGLARILRGPGPADRMLAAQLLGTTGVALLVVLAHALETPELRNVALVFALMGSVAAVAFVKSAAAERDRSA